MSQPKVPWDEAPPWGSLFERLTLDVHRWAPTYSQLVVCFPAPEVVRNASPGLHSAFHFEAQRGGEVNGSLEFSWGEKIHRKVADVFKGIGIGLVFVLKSLAFILLLSRMSMVLLSRWQGKRKQQRSRGLVRALWMYLSLYTYIDFSQKRL